MIEAEGLTRKFGERTVVDGVTLHVNEGEVFGFLGPNGAGKTTTVRMLCGLISISSGRARIGGLEVGPKEDALRIRGMIGLLPENVGLYEELSAYANLDYFGRLYDCPDGARRASIERLLRALELWDRRDQPVGTFSKGMKQKVAIARALVHDPKVVFLDEPTANLDPEAAKTVRDYLLELRREDRTIFLTTHNLDEAQRVCDRIGILKTKLLATGPPEELKGVVGGRRTLVELDRVDGTIVEAVRARLGPLRVEVEGNSLSVEVSDPARQNPDLVEAIVRAGGRVRTVSERAPSLEDVYLSTVRE